MTIVDEERQKQKQPPPAATLETLQEKIDKCANTIIGLHTIYRDRKKTIIQQLQEIRQLAEDLNIDYIRLRRMVSQPFTIMDVYSSWMRKLLPEYLKSTKHTRKDYLELQQQQQKELVELPSLSSRHSVSEQQPQDEETFTALGYLQLFDNDVPIKVTVNVKTKSIEAMEIAHEIVHSAKTYQHQ
jgi:hypothetical protein